jgi:hypothetical protein
MSGFVRTSISAVLIAAAPSMGSAQAAARSTVPPVTRVPASFFELLRDQDREVARRFYGKHIDVKGMPVVASSVVADEALQRTYTIVTRMLAGRPDVLESMVKNRMYLIIIGKDQCNCGYGSCGSTQKRQLQQLPRSQ